MKAIEINNFVELPCGENSQQNAGISMHEGCINYEILSRNKELDYLDYLDLSEAVKILGEFFDVDCCVISKGALIRSVALGQDLNLAFEKAIDCNPVSIVNGTVGFSKNVTIDIAQFLNSMNVKNVIAPSFSKDAFSYLLETSINIIVVKTPLHELQGFSIQDIKVTPFGLLLQDQNNIKLSKDTFKVVSIQKPTSQQVEDAVFAWKVAKHLKSSSAVIVKDFAARGISQGESDTFAAVKNVLETTCEYSKDSVLALDGVIENNEIINAAIQCRVGLIIESGDSIKSPEILKYADKYGLSLIFTKLRINRY